ncbi:uncharacterized protein LOC132551213 [Ylistrum balloti]|uniref:uncharacterized protein LOC132551213 n=1 Tax=Ylistrum balloti TaxID=509963 RepID=UPI002905F6A7|nr:uncharacterized protein LOC132551213 [Ylistrum balloti]
MTNRQVHLTGFIKAENRDEQLSQYQPEEKKDKKKRQPSLRELWSSEDEEKKPKKRKKQMTKTSTVNISKRQRDQKVGEKSLENEHEFHDQQKSGYIPDIKDSHVENNISAGKDIKTRNFTNQYGRVEMKMEGLHRSEFSRLSLQEKTDTWINTDDCYSSQNGNNPYVEKEGNFPNEGVHISLNNRKQSERHEEWQKQLENFNMKFESFKKETKKKKV